MRTMTLPAAALLAALLGAGAAAEEPRVLRVLTTTTDLASIAREVGGDSVRVACLTTGPEDPHFLDARPSFVRQAHDADLFVKVGLDLEAGYEVPIVRDARNPRIQPGMPGACDASAGVDLLEIPTGTLDRSLGDVHPLGNPHYLADPVRAKTAAENIAASLGKVDPARAAAFAARAAAFGTRVDETLFGRRLLEHAPSKRLARLLAEGKLGAWLDERKIRDAVGGWAKEMVPFSGARVVAYHSSFVYLADRFHLEIAASLEPKAGVPPSPRHVRTVVETMRLQRIPAILCTAFNPRGIPDSVAAETGAKVVVLAHMPGAIAGTGDYLACVGANVRLLKEVLGEGR